MKPIFIEIQIDMSHLEAVKEEQERAIMKHVPDFAEPNAFQRKIMQHVSDVADLAVIQDKGTGVKFVGQTMLTSKGCFTQRRFNPILPKDCIIMNMHATDPQWYSVLFHEMAHATGSARFLNRKGLSADKDLLDYAFEELIAETVAEQVMERLGYATQGTRSFSYQYKTMYEWHYRLTHGQDGWRPIDTAKLESDVAEAKSLVLQWLSHFDACNESAVSERVKEFNRFF